MAVIKRKQAVKRLQESFSKKSKDKIKKLVQKSDAGFFCLGSKSHKAFIEMLSPIQEIDKEGNVWFSIPGSSYKYGKDNFIRLLFQGKAFSDFIMIEGNYTIYIDRDIKSGKTDKQKNAAPILIKVVLTEAYCWETKQKKVVALLKDENFSATTSASERKVRVG